MNASVRPSRYILLNLWPEFNQTCYMTSPRGKGVRKQHFLPCPMWPSGGVTWPVMNLAVPISYQRSLKITNECQKCYQYDLVTVLRSKRHIFLWILFQSGKNDSQIMVWLKKCGLNLFICKGSLFRDYAFNKSYTNGFCSGQTFGIKAVSCFYSLCTKCKYQQFILEFFPRK